MRLLTHNMLQCPRTRAYPLELQIDTCDEVEVDYSAAFVRRMLPRLDWAVFLAAARQLPDDQLVAQLPPHPPAHDQSAEHDQDDADDDPILRAVHRALLQWHVVEGRLVAEGAVYRVSNGVPNLVITEVRKQDDPDQQMPDADPPADAESQDGADGDAAAS